MLALRVPGHAGAEGVKSAEQVLAEWVTDEIRFDGGVPGELQVFNREGFVNLVHSIKTGERWYVVHPGMGPPVGGTRVGTGFKIADDVLNRQLLQEIQLYGLGQLTPRWFARFESLKEALEVIESGRMLVA